MIKHIDLIKLFEAIKEDILLNEEGIKKGLSMEELAIQNIHSGDKVAITEPDLTFNTDENAAKILDLKNWEKGYIPNKGDVGTIDDVITVTIGDKAFIVKLDNGKEIIIEVTGVKKIK